MQIGWSKSCREHTTNDASASAIVRNSKNRAFLSWLGGGAVVIITGLWAVIVYVFPHHVPANVQAHCGSVAIGGNVTGTTITGGTTTSTDCSVKPK
jgi:hypothetical protein